MYFTFMFTIITKKIYEIIRTNRKSWCGALGFLLKLIVNIFYDIIFNLFGKNLISLLNEPQVWMNDPHKDKALGGWIDKVHNLADERR